MNASAIRIGIALFLVAHGLIHMSLSTVPVPKPGELHTPFWPGWWRADVDSTWPASRFGLPPAVVRTVGWVLWAASLAGFAAAGLGLLGVPGLSAVWQGTAGGASLISLVLLGLYWHPWLPVGVVINLAVLAGLWLKWPAALFMN